MSLFQTVPPKRYLVEFNAGKCIVEGNLVKPDLRKGKIYLDQPGDQLLHLYWKERESQADAEDDIIIFSGEATFTRVTECTTGRVYLLKTSNSNEKYFYWMQSKSDQEDQENVNSINELIGSSEDDINMSTELDENASHTEIMRLLSGVENQDPNITEENILEFLQNMSRSRRPQTEEQRSPAVKRPAVKRPAESENTDYGQLAQMLTPGRSSVTLSDILNNQSITPLLNDTQICESLLPFLPEESEQSVEEVRQVVKSPQFSQALQSLTVALQTGQLGPLLSQFGLDPSSGYGVEAFLNAIDKQTKENAMEED